MKEVIWFTQSERHATSFWTKFLVHQAEKNLTQRYIISYVFIDGTITDTLHTQKKQDM